METSSQILLSTSEAKVAALPSSSSRSFPDHCGKVYHPVNSEQFKSLIHKMQQPSVHLAKRVDPYQDYYDVAGKTFQKYAQLITHPSPEKIRIE